jgi:hypothetical protein
MEIETMPQIGESPLEKFKSGDQYEKILADVIFLAQDEKGKRLKKYLFGSGIHEEEAVYVIARYLLKNRNSKQNDDFPDDLEDNQKQLETLMMDQQAVNFMGNPNIVKEYLHHMSDELTGYILKGSLAEEKKVDENIIRSRVQSIKKLVMKKVKVSML